MHLQVHWQPVSKCPPYLYSFLACCKAKLHGILKEYNKQFFYQILDLLHLGIKCLRYQAIIFSYFFQNLDINKSKLKNRLPLCIFLPMNGTMFRIRSSKAKIYLQTKLQLHLLQVLLLYHFQNKCFHKYLK